MQFKGVRDVGTSLRQAVRVTAAASVMLVSAQALAEPEGEPSSPPGYVGIWFDETGNGAIQIERCGEQLCGRIVWLRNPADEKGVPLVDALNPTEAERARPVCGLQVMGDLKRQNDGSWDTGWIYDYREGKTYNVALRLRASDRLEVTGYRGVKLLSETQTWKRAGARLPICTQKAPDVGATN
jgi:uncharacterized protein (DUF2147 family)